ncbi:MAG: Asp-tRNA(Asn)/Glu-tRNA(Gln) amidotransferase subunit GatC [Pseudomonadales bacterium]
MSDPIDTAHLCRLSQLALDPAQTAELQRDLANIVQMIDAMQAIDTDGVAPLAHPLETHQRLRADQVTESVDRSSFQAVAPETQSGLYLVPRVVE